MQICVFKCHLFAFQSLQCINLDNLISNLCLMPICLKAGHSSSGCIFKAPTNEETLLQKHCCGNIVARNVSTASKQVGSKTNVLLPCRTNQKNIWGNICCGRKMFLKKFTNSFCVHDKCCVCAQTGKHLRLQQCFLVCGGL